MKKTLLFAFILTVLVGVFGGYRSRENFNQAMQYKAERDSLMVAHKCPRPIRLRLSAKIGCLNVSAQRPDRDLRVSSFKTAAGDTVDFLPLCESCFDGLSTKERLPFYEKLTMLYEEQNRREIALQVKENK